MVIQSGQIAIGSFQGITLWAEGVNTVNIVIAFVQALLGVVSIWTRDLNKNDIIDIAEPITTTVTVTAPGSAEVKVEKKENPAHGFTEGADMS